MAPRGAPLISLFGLDPATWSPHALHDVERTYTETNCYTDVMIELVAASGADPTAMLGGAVSVDFEFDQWTFFKPPPEDLRVLYGLEVHEMQPLGDLPHQIADRLCAGHAMIPELDAYYLPDTATTSYRTEHVKTSIVAESIDLDARILRYFHNAGYYELSGEDYGAAFRLDDGATEPAYRAPDVLPPYVDLVRFDAGRRLEGEQLRLTALELLAGHLSRRPADNPFSRFGGQLEDDLPGLLAGELADYHAYAFATVRMAGAAFELLATHVRWLLGDDGEPCAGVLDDVVGGTKMLSFRLARRREFDVAAAIGPMADGWQRATQLLDELVPTRS